MTGREFTTDGPATVRSVVMFQAVRDLAILRHPIDLAARIQWMRDWADATAAYDLDMSALIEEAIRSMTKGGNA